MNSDIKKGDTVSINGITGVFFCSPELGIFAIRPVPSVSLTTTQAIERGGRGLNFYVLGHTILYHIEDENIIADARLVMVEKTTKCLIRSEKVHKRLVED